MIAQAMEYSKNKHSGQVRKIKGEAYFNHPHRVAKIIFEVKSSHELDALIAAALLHDVVEDTKTKVSEINEYFGELVASLVEELTSNKSLSNKMGKAEYLKYKMINMSSWGLLIKLADRLDNISDLEDASEAFRTKYVLETETIITGITEKRVLTSTHNVLIARINKKLKSLK